MITHKLRRLSGIFLLFSILLSLPLQAQSTDRLPYVEPSFGSPLFEADPHLDDTLTDEEFLALYEALVSVLKHPKVKATDRAKAMLLAYSLFESTHGKELILMDFKLRYAQPLETDESLASMEASELASKLFSAIIPLEPKDKRKYLGEFNGRQRFEFANLSSGDRSAWSFLFSLYHTVREKTPLLEDEDIPNALASLDSAWEPAFAKVQTHTSTVSSVMPSALSSGVAMDGAGQVDGFARRQSKIKGLLVVQLQGAYAGQASQMNAIVVPGIPGASTRIRFNQSVGKDMTEALVRVHEFTEKNHGDFPEGHNIELSFEEQYTPKDGPSAAVACALLMDSLCGGDALDPGFAVTGDMTTTGQVEPVGGISGKLRGAAAYGCTHAAVPDENAEALLDILIVEGIETITKLQVFTIETFDQAKELAQPPESRDPELADAMEKFSTIQLLLQREGYAENVLRNRQVQQRLQEILVAAPNHASAKTLLLKGLGREPDQLTLYGSMDAIDRAALPLLQGLDTASFGRGAKSSGSLMENDEFADAAYNLRRIRHKLNSRTLKIADAMTDYADLLRQLENNPPNTPAIYNKLVDEINSKGKDLSNAYKMLSEQVRQEEEAKDKFVK